MKLNIEIDLSPDEARRVMGLPDVTKMQETIAAEMEKSEQADSEKLHAAETAFATEHKISLK